MGAGYGTPHSASLLKDLPVQVLGRMRSDRVLRQAAPLALPASGAVRAACDQLRLACPLVADFDGCGRNPARRVSSSPPAPVAISSASPEGRLLDPGAETPPGPAMAATKPQEHPAPPHVTTSTPHRLKNKPESVWS